MQGIRGKLLFECMGGDRDRGKRPLMAEVACRLSDQVILTSDNPRTEDPEKILDDVRKGVPAEAETRVLSITNRHEAIKTAVTLARKGDIVLLAGKGHETYQEIHGVRHHFDDREELASLSKPAPETRNLKPETRNLKPDTL